MAEFLFVMSRAESNQPLVYQPLDIAPKSVCPPFERTDRERTAPSGCPVIDAEEEALPCRNRKGLPSYRSRPAQRGLATLRG